LLVRVDGSTEVVDLDAGDEATVIRAAIGCQWFEAHPAGPGLRVWIDEEGRLNGSTPNIAASSLAVVSGSPQSPLFRGNALFTDAGGRRGDLVGLDETTQLGLLSWLAFLGPFPVLRAPKAATP
jgi:hypothetical protein